MPVLMFLLSFGRTGSNAYSTSAGHALGTGSRLLSRVRPLQRRVESATLDGPPRCWPSSFVQRELPAEGQDADTGNRRHGNPLMGLPSQPPGNALTPSGDHGKARHGAG